MSKSKIKSLSKKIIKAREDYYNAQPTISDATFDKLIDELTALDPEHPSVTAVGATVGVSEWKKVAHTVPMGSLNKAKNEEEFRKWAEECIEPGSIILLSDKLDGISISTEWDQGVLTQALTRGNGSTGEDITVNVRRMKGIPGKLQSKFTGNIRGEIVLCKSDHKKHFPDYSNPRNAASGIAKRLDGQGAEHLTVMMYTISTGKEFETEEKQLDFITNLGLQQPYYGSFDTVDKVMKKYHAYEESLRDKLDYEIDGLVARVDNIADQLVFGEKNHRPKGAIAFKFKSEECETILRDIIWQVGNSGRITPVGEFDMVHIAGADITRASLYNHSYIKELGVDIGAEILVIRSNDVIPRCEEVLKSTNTVAKVPKKCPECSESTSFDGEYLCCTNKECPARVLGKLKSWVNELNILNWSTATLQRVIDAGLVEDVGDLYRVTVDQLEKLDRMGRKSAEKLVAIMNSHKNIPIQNLIGGLGINGVATSTAKSVVDAGYNTLDAFRGMSIADFEGIDKFATTRATAFYHGLRENKDRIDDILAAGVTIKAKPQGTLTGKNFCFTGSSTLPRKELHKLVEAQGGDVKKSVGKGLQYLVLADLNITSGKTKAAIKFGTKCISEEDFMRMIE